MPVDYNDPIAHEDNLYDHEKRIPLARSPIYPPDIVADDMFVFRLPPDLSEDHLSDQAQNTAEMDESSSDVDINDINDVNDVVRESDADTTERDSDTEYIDSESDSSDSDVELMYGTPWRVARTAISKQTIEDHEKQRLSHKLYINMLREFRPLFLAVPNADRIVDTVKKLVNKPLHLRFPENWYLLPQKAVHIRVLKTVNVNEYVCCNSYLIPLGACAARSPDLQFRETPCALLMDGRGRFFLYDSESDGMYFAAMNLEQLARQGLSLCEPVYRDDGAVMCMPKPKNVVRKLISAAVIGMENVCAAVSMFKGITVSATDPATNTIRTLQIFGVEELRRKIPFAAMDDDLYTMMLNYIGFRLAETWVVLGGIGSYDGNDPFFTVSTIVIVGARGTVYGFVVQKNDIFRMAEDLSVFLRRGAGSICNRFDRGARGELRLEQCPICPHVPSRSSQMLKSIKINVTRRDMKNWYHWLTHTHPTHTKPVALSNIEEIKLQLSHPTKNTPLRVVSDESYHPTHTPDDAFSSLSEDVRPFTFPREVDSLENMQLDFYGKLIQTLGPFNKDIERPEHEVLTFRFKCLSELQKMTSPLKLPPVYQAIESLNGKTVTNF